MEDNSRKRFRKASITFWLLLVYIIAALVWWFISLEKQNQLISKEQFTNLSIQQPSLSAIQFAEKKQTLQEQEKRNTAKYIAEGITFLILILIGASFVYRSLRRQFKLQQQQQNFMMAVTHELKTPIAVVRLNLETLQKYQLEPEKQQKIIRTTLDETSRLNFLTTNILVASQLESRRYNAAKEELDLSNLCMDCVQDFNNRFPDRNFISQIEPDADVAGDALLLQMLINNLLENAIKYSPKGSPVTINLSKHPKRIILAIIDAGEGIPDNEKTKVFAKFYRIGNEATRKTQGTGLGLYLCSKIAKEHNAEITVADAKPTGANISVVFNL